MYKLSIYPQQKCVSKTKMKFVYFLAIFICVSTQYSCSLSSKRTDLKYLFHVYGQNNFSTSEDINTFLDNFMHNLNAPKLADVQRLICLQEKLNHFKNFTVKQWNRNVLIDKYDFSKISAHLIAFINKCFEIKANESVLHHPDEILQLNEEKSVWKLVLEKLPSISKESMNIILNL